MLKKLLDLLKGRKTDGGFTLIEIVIVLAIAGLIFVIVFLAVGQAQASRRDTARRSDASRFAASVNQYQANNGGNNPPSNWTGTDYYDPGTESDAGANGLTNDGDMDYTAGVDCDGNSGTREYKVEVKLEKGGIYCVGS